MFHSWAPHVTRSRQCGGLLVVMSSSSLQVGPVLGRGMPFSRPLFSSSSGLGHFHLVNVIFGTKEKSQVLSDQMAANEFAESPLLCSVLSEHTCTFLAIVSFSRQLLFKVHEGKKPVFVGLTRPFSIVWVCVDRLKICGTTHHQPSVWAEACSWSHKSFPFFYCIAP